MRYRITTVHGEGGSRFHVVDDGAPESLQPAIVETHHTRHDAEISCGTLNLMWDNGTCADCNGTGYTVEQTGEEKDGTPITETRECEHLSFAAFVAKYGCEILKEQETPFTKELIRRLFDKTEK